MLRHSFGVLALAALSIALSLAQDGGQKPAPAPDPLAVLFETKIRPILINRCEECHADKADGDLRVDSREALMKGGESGVVIVPGDPDASVLIQAVRRTHAKLSMPKRRAKLPDDEIEALAEWVQKGAYWPDAAAVATPPVLAPGKKITPEQRAFWSLQPIARPAVPEVANASWPASDIDRFVLARLEHEGLAPVAAADRRTLIRRATLDLTGLPPTPEEIEAFVGDTADDAFAKVVDRLLASPRYGETWGRWWLDVARYAEDDCRSLDPMGRGYNPYPNAYRYRDWVIKALNDDLPYDGFVKAQLAADLLETPPRANLLPALGFLGLGPWYYDNGSVEVTRADERHDRVDAVSRGLLGLTVACARCHDHKYDPIATEDYYALAGVFKNTTYYEYAEVPQSVIDDYKTQEKRIESKEKLRREFQRTESKQLAETLAFQTANYMRAAWKVADDPKHDKARVADQEKLDYELLDRWIAFLAKPPKHYPNLVPWQELIARKGTKEEASKLADEFQTQLLDVMFEHIELDEENDIIRAKALPGTTKKKRAKLPSDFVTNDDFCPGCGLELKSLPLEKQNLWSDVFDRDLDAELNLAQGEFDDYKPGVLSFSGHWLERQLSADRFRYVQALTADIKALRKALPPKYPFVHGVAEAAEIVPICVHVRGSPFKLGAEVPRHFPALLCPDEPQPFAAGSGRRELAEAIVAQPITLRVIVNRVWKGHFGTGIVDTPGDFGRNGERPTNPELLEYLAARFVDDGLSLKKLHRAILLTSVYQLSSSDSPANSAVDSGNRLYWRANERRMTAEQIRDSALFVSGALDEKMAGPSEKLTPLGKRRTVYGQISRYRLDGFLALFDFPAALASAERRFTTHVPLQRLFFMNSDFMQQQGELLARRVASESNDGARIQKTYSLLFGRAASDEEVSTGLAYIQAEPMKQYEERKAARIAKEAADKDKPPGAAMPGKSEDYDDESGDDGDKDGDAAGMMAGVDGAGAGEKPDNKLLPVTVWGRYAKVLMSSSEFLFTR